MSVLAGQASEAFLGGVGAAGLFVLREGARRGEVRWAGIVVLLVVIQITLGMSGKSIPALGALHGLNALLLFSAAIHTGRRTRAVAAAPAAESLERVETPA
jgi:heme A synthase